MSKRHQSSRRKTYGRRQHELHERAAARAAADRGPRSSLDDVGAAGDRRPLRVPRPAQRRASASRSATEGGRLPGRAPAHHRPPAPPADRLAASPRRRPCPRRRPRSAVRARRGAVAARPAPGGDRRSRSLRRSSRWPRTSASPRPATRSTASTTEQRAARRPAPTTCAPSSTASASAPAIRKQAIDAGLGPLPEPDRRPGPLGEPDRPMLGRTDSRAPRGCSSCSSPSCVGGGRLGVRLAYWQVVRRDELAAHGGAQTIDRARASPSRRGSIYDRTGTVVLATSVERDRLAAHRQAAHAERARGRAASSSTILGLDGRRRHRRSRRA